MTTLIIAGLLLISPQVPARRDRIAVHEALIRLNDGASPDEVRAVLGPPR